MNKETRLPIKVVIPHDTDFYTPESGGGGKTIFGTVDRSLRLELSNQIKKVEIAFQKTFEAQPDLPAVAKVVLKEEAYAKSHRPSALLREQTCPIIGVRHFGEILTTATPAGLSNLRMQLLEDNAKVVVANISTIARIEPYGKDDAVEIGIDSLEKLLSSGLRVLKFKLFQHHHKNLDTALLWAFHEQIRLLNLPDPEEIHYAKGLKIYSIEDVSPRVMKKLAGR